MIFKKRISLKIAAIIVIVEIIAMTALYFTVDHYLTEILEKKSIGMMSIIARDRAQLVESYIKSCCDFLDSYSRSPEIVLAIENRDNPEYLEYIRKVTENYTKNNSSIEGLYVADWDTYVLAHNNSESVDKTFRSKESSLLLEKTIREKNKSFCAGIMQAPVTKKMVISVYTPVFDKNMEAIGFAGAAFYADELWKNFSALDDKRTTYSLINAVDNIYIFNDDSNLIGTQCKNQDMINIISELKKNPAPGLTKSFITDDFLVTSYFMPERNCFFFISASNEIVFETIKASRKLMIKIGLLITALMAFVCILSVEYLMTPIRIINFQLERFKKNDYRHGFLLERYFGRKDEVGTIANAVNDLRSVLENQYGLFLEILEAQMVGTLVTNAEDDKIILINKMALKIYGIDPARKKTVTLQEIQRLFSKNETAKIKKIREDAKTSKEEILYETVVNREDGIQLPLLSHAKNTVLSNGESVVIFSFIDISDRKKLEENLRMLSETDSLTAIFNRRSGEEKIKEAILKNKKGMFCILDANKFKYINDNFGHVAGDQVLLEIAGNLKKTFSDSDILVRLGGDEFVVFAPDIDTKEKGASVLEEFLNRIEKINIPALNGHKVSVSIGAIINEEDDFSQLYKKADSLMYSCKKHGGNTFLFAES